MKTFDMSVMFLMLPKRGIYRPAIPLSQRKILIIVDARLCS